MTNAELRELDAWIAEHAMGWKLVNYKTGVFAKTKSDYKDASINDGWAWGDGDNEAWQWKPTKSPADAMRVLRECHKRLGPLAIMTSYQPEVGGYWIRAVPEHGKHIEGIAETLELSAALFARKLFSK